MHSSVHIQPDFSLSALNTFGIDVSARAYAAIHSVEDLITLRQDRGLAMMPRLVLGAGSNLLFMRDFPGLVLHMCMKGKSASFDDEHQILVTAAAGENWHEFVLWTLDKGWGGLENLSFIPGTVGAAPIQNIGAYGAEVKDFVHSLRAFDFCTGQMRHFTKKDCQFAYRDSFFKQQGTNRHVIVDVTFSLARLWQPNLSFAEVANVFAGRQSSSLSPREIASAITAIRERKLPNPEQTGNAGSFFKNPTISGLFFQELKAVHPDMPGFKQADDSFRVAAGWLIDQCGWRGKTSGNVGVYEHQALVLVNRGGAKADEIIALANAIRQDVWDRFGIWLEAEPVFV